MAGSLACPEICATGFDLVFDPVGFEFFLILEFFFILEFFLILEFLLFSVFSVFLVFLVSLVFLVVLLVLAVFCDPAAVAALGLSLALADLVSLDDFLTFPVLASAMLSSPLNFVSRLSQTKPPLDIKPESK